MRSHVNEVLNDKLLEIEQAQKTDPENAPNYRNSLRIFNTFKRAFSHLENVDMLNQNNVKYLHKRKLNDDELGTALHLEYLDNGLESKVAAEDIQWNIFAELCNQD